MAKTSQDRIIEELMKSNILLQNKTAELISTINKLTKKMSKMVSTFEEAAEKIKEGTDEPLKKKLQELLDQNRNVAKGLIMLERYVRDKSAVQEFPPKPLPTSL